MGKKVNVKPILTVACYLLALGAAPVHAESSSEGVLTQKQLEAAKELMDTSRNIALILNLDLTEQENEEFWPLYEEYRKKIGTVRERKLLLVDEYAARYRDDSVDDEFADRAIKDSVKIQIETAKIRDKYWRKFRLIIPVKKAARFYQLENKMDAEVEYILAGGVPLVETE